MAAPGRKRADRRHLPPETALQAALLLRDGTCLLGLRELALAQEPCEAKRHEITAIPRLLARVILVLA